MNLDEHDVCKEDPFASKFYNLLPGLSYFKLASEERGVGRERREREGRGERGRKREGLDKHTLWLDERDALPGKIDPWSKLNSTRDMTPDPQNACRSNREPEVTPPDSCLMTWSLDLMTWWPVQSCRYVWAWMRNGKGKRGHNMKIKKGGGGVVMEGEKLELIVTYRVWRGCLTFNHLIGESHPRLQTTRGKPWLDVLEEMGARGKGAEGRGEEWRRRKRKMQKPKSIPWRSDCYHQRLEGGVAVGWQQWETYCNEYSLIATRWSVGRELEIYIYIYEHGVQTTTHGRGSITAHLLMRMS